MSKTETIRTWFEILLRTDEEWIPADLADATEQHYSTTEFSAPSDNFDDSLFQMLRFAAGTSSGMWRSMDFYDLLHICETRKTEAGTKLFTKTFMVLPSEAVQFFDVAGQRTVTSTKLEGTAIVQLKRALQMSGFVKSFRKPRP